MSNVNIANSVLTGAGTCVEMRIAGLGCLDFFIDDNGGGSTITFEQSPDGSTWNPFAYQVFTTGTTGQLVYNGSTTTAKGRYLIDLTGLINLGVSYVRARVSTYVSGTVVTRYEESAAPLNRIINMLATGIAAQGTNQGNAIPLNAAFNHFSTVGASQGALLPSNVPRNGEVSVRNSGANALLVYPPVGYSINGGAANASASVAAGTASRFISDGVGNYWSF